MSRFRLFIGCCAALIALLLSAAHLRGADEEARETPPSVSADDPVEKEFQKLLAGDDEAQEEIDRWLNENDAFAKAGAGTPEGVLRARIQTRLKAVRQSYDDFLKRHPDHARAHLAYGSFLNDLGEEYQASEQWKRARSLNPKHPAAWNNLGNYYGHNGYLTNAFACYEKAIELNPKEPVYYQNFATTVYLFRRDAEAYFKFDETQVFDKALSLYRQALALDPENFLLSTDYAQSYYGIKPLRTEDALKAWNDTLKIARDDVEREGVRIHLARINILAERFDIARTHLSKVTNEMYDALKGRVARNLEYRQGEAAKAALSAPAEPEEP